MALITCHECGGKVSDAATACPHCGAPVLPAAPAPTPPRGAFAGLIEWVVGLGAAAAFAGGVFWLALPDEPEPAASPGRESRPAPRPSVDAQTQAKVKAAIEAAGFWCGRVTRYYRLPGESSANYPVYYAFCDDETNAVIYHMHLDRSGKVLDITEQ